MCIRDRIYGELLNTYGYELAGGEKSFSCINYYTGEEISIPLDPQLSAKDNAKTVSYTHLSNSGYSSFGGPGRRIAVFPFFFNISPGAIPLGLSSTIAPWGTIAIFQLLSGIDIGKKWENSHSSSGPAK